MHRFKNEPGTPKPDLLVHVPGDGDNYAVIEVKSSRARAREIRKDLRTLSRFANFGYQRAIYLIYGAEAVLDRIQLCAGEVVIPIEVWFHPADAASTTRAFTLPLSE